MDLGEKGLLRRLVGSILVFVSFLLRSTFDDAELTAFSIRMVRPTVLLNKLKNT